MPAGITVYNTSNIVQVDETYRNLLLVASGQFTASAGNTSSDAWYNQLGPVWARLTPQAIMMVRATVYPGLNLNVGSYRNGMKICNFNYRTDAPAQTFQYYIFDNVNPAGNTQGFQVYTGGGVLVYDAYDYPLIPIATVDTEFAGASGVLYSGPHSQLAYGSSGGGFYFDNDGSFVEEDRIYTYWSGNTLYQVPLHNVRQRGDDPLGQYGRIDQSGIIIDTTTLPKNFFRG